jgi:diguanylate cyclase
MGILMAVGGEVHQAGLWSKQAIEHLARDGLVPTPRNYDVYYHYHAGDMAELNAAFDAIMSQGKMSAATCVGLYQKFLAISDDAEFVKDASSIFDSEIKKVMALISASTKETDQFGENLTTFTGKLSGAASLDVLRDAVAKIAEETRSVVTQNQKLQNELAATTTQLSEIRADFDRVHRESQIDPLTEVGNRKFFDREIAVAVAEAEQKSTVLSLLMVDIDHFKKFNDTYGHLIGDQVLRLVARTLVENLKGRDIIARYGGEEFVILLPQTRVQDAERVANQLRAGLATKHIKKRGSNETLGAITISLGAAEFIPGEESNSLIARADSALYRAKQSGRNRVMCADTSDASR